MVSQTGSQSRPHHRTPCITLGRIQTAVAPSFLQRLISSTASVGLIGIVTHQRWRLDVDHTLAVQSFKARATAYWNSRFRISGMNNPSVGIQTAASIPL